VSLALSFTSTTCNGALRKPRKIIFLYLKIYIIISKERWWRDKSHSEDSNLLWCHVMSVGKHVPTFYHDLVDFKDEGTTILQDVGNCLVLIQHNITEEFKSLLQHWENVRSKNMKLLVFVLGSLVLSQGMSIRIRQLVLPPGMSERCNISQHTSQQSPTCPWFVWRLRCIQCTVTRSFTQKTKKKIAVSHKRGPPLLSPASRFIKKLWTRWLEMPEMRYNQVVPVRISSGSLNSFH
jgi:hypothetical protein